ncbi:MAG: ABC transporter ATP-binding protein [Acutalibacteraceae bacterium]|nr:ABC transporter ATP-binding protein [Acutalibacteraceae bacterium]
MSSKEERKKMKELYQENYGLKALLYFLIILTALFNVASAFAIQTTVDVISSHDVEKFKLAIILFALFFVGLVLSQYFYMKAYNTYSCYVGRVLRENLFKNIIKKNYNEFSKRETGDYISMLTIDAQKLEEGYFLSKITIANNIISIGSSVLSMLIMSWKLSLVVFVFALIPIVVSSYFGKNLPKLNAEIIDSNDKMVSFTKEALSGFSVMKSFLVEKNILKRFLKVNEKRQKSMQAVSDEAAKIMVFTEGANSAVLIGTIAVGSIMIFNSMLTVGTIMAFFELLMNILTPIEEFSRNMALQKGVKPIVLKVIEDSEGNEKQEQNKLQIEEFKDSVNIENLTFSYDKEVNALQDISLQIEKGKKYALVGNSGCGKSTLFGLLRGYYPDYSGNLKIDDTEIRDISIYSINKMVSIVDQSVFIYNASIRDNITLFSDYSDEQIYNVVHMAGLDDFVEKNGLDALCGEDGNLISGGERQRISIARCLLRNTQILLFDEGTSALDNRIANDIENLILSLDKTCVAITHRLNPNILRKYDRIFILDKGKLVEYGDYEYLIQQQGRLWEQIQLLQD